MDPTIHFKKRDFKVLSWVGGIQCHFLVLFMVILNTTGEFSDPDSRHPNRSVRVMANYLYSNFEEIKS